MKQGNYNFRLARTIKALRKLRCRTQQEIADALFVERSTYTKLENNEVAITVDNLKEISEILKISVFQTLVIAESDTLVDFTYHSLSEILLDYSSIIAGEEEVSKRSKQLIESLSAKTKLQWRSEQS